MNLKTANKQKDFDLVTKEKTIEKKETESKYLKDEKILLNKKNDNLDKANNESEICCQVCEDKFKTKTDLKSHIANKHKVNADSTQCLNCKDNVHLMKSKECIARLQVISKDLVEEKKKHKTICPVSSNCPHEMACSRNCYFA